MQSLLTMPEHFTNYVRDAIRASRILDLIPAEVVELRLGPTGMEKGTGDRYHVCEFWCEHWQAMDLPRLVPREALAASWLGVVHDAGACLIELPQETHE